MGNFLPGNQPLHSPNSLYERLEGSAIRCRVCARQCMIPEGSESFCRVRRNQSGQMRIPDGFPVSRTVLTTMYRLRLSDTQTSDPVLAVGGWGCNLYCRHCINARWSYAGIPADTTYCQPEALIARALDSKCTALAFSVTEPIIHLENLVPILASAHQYQLQTLLCTNGLFTRESLDWVLPLVDGFRIDLKGFSDKTYSGLTGFAGFTPLMDILEIITKAIKQLTLQFVPIPEINDSPLDIENGIRQLVKKGITVPEITILRFIPSGWMTDRPAADDRYLYKIACMFEQYGVSTLIREV